METQWIVILRDLNDFEEDLPIYYDTYEEAFEHWLLNVQQIESIHETDPDQARKLETYINTIQDSISIGLIGYDYWGFVYDHLRNHFEVSCVQFYSRSNDANSPTPYRYYTFNKEALVDLYNAFKTRMEIET